MLLSAVSVLVVTRSSSEIPDGLMNNSVDNLYSTFCMRLFVCIINHVVNVCTKLILSQCHPLLID